HLLDALPSRLIARFDVDALVDYRGHRPRMVFSGDRYDSITSPEIGLHALEDDGGTPFLLLHGAEPDYAWERFTAAVLQLVERLGVTRVVALHAIPMPVPHTRPVTVTAHATRRQLIESYPVYWGEMRIPGSVGALLELRLGEAGVDALGVGAHVPHYLAQATYPAASLTLLEHLERLTGLHVPTETLREAAEANRTEVDEQIGRSSENTAVVAALEEQFDSFTASRDDTGLLGFSGEMPSGEELGAQIERFLAEQDERPTD
ncbi:MAG: putative ATP-grasp superfamily enzyme, partial [Modestobacter sp.]|nr:putative ATP-grasp superfamily enzyme [Modestobacter sp.]